MKKHISVAVFLIFLSVCVAAQDSAAGTADDFFDGDIDSLFEDVPESDPIDNPPPPVNNAPPPSNNAPSVLASALKKIGFTLDARFNFAAGYAPGWIKAPWYWDEERDPVTYRYDDEVDNFFMAKMESKIALDIQISDVFRVRQTLALAIPSLAITIPEFFFDYNLLNIVFFRAGKYSFNWGISPNFPYANLPSRIPNSREKEVDLYGDLYILRADIPIGVGGFQLALMTRSSILGSNGHIDTPEHPNLNNIDKERITIADKVFWGAKFNLAVPYFDFDMGLLYNTKQDSRAFLALKTTLFNQLELYAEGLLSFNSGTSDRFGGSASIGFMQEFFNRQLSVNAELFYNGEEKATYTPASSFFGKDDAIPLISGLNTALNIRYKPSWFKKTEFFLNYLHGFNENTVQLVPGFRITPLSNLNLYVAVPMALGSEKGQYYNYNVDEKNRPFSIILMVTFSGNYRYSNN